MEMSQPKASMTAHKLDESASVIEIQGEVTAAAENALMEAYNQAVESGARTIILDFEKLDYMNSSGIGLLVTLLIRAKRQGQRLLACGLSEHYKQIFELTRLNEAIVIYDDKVQAIAAA